MLVELRAELVIILAAQREGGAVSRKGAQDKMRRRLSKTISVCAIEVEADTGRAKTKPGARTVNGERGAQAWVRDWSDVLCGLGQEAKQDCRAHESP